MKNYVKISSNTGMNQIYNTENAIEAEIRNGTCNHFFAKNHQIDFISFTWNPFRNGVIFGTIPKSIWQVAFFNTFNHISCSIFLKQFFLLGFKNVFFFFELKVYMVTLYRRIRKAYERKFKSEIEKLFWSLDRVQNLQLLQRIFHKMHSVRKFF